MSKVSRKKPVQWERTEQQALVAWFRLQHPKELLVHIPNGYVRGCAQARIAWLDGVQPGMPDLILFAPRGRFAGLAIELKRPIIKGEPKGVVSAAQKEIIEHLNAQGYMAIVCFGWEAARLTIEKYLKLNKR